MGHSPEYKGGPFRLVCYCRRRAPLVDHGPTLATTGESGCVYRVGVGQYDSSGLCPDWRPCKRETVYSVRRPDVAELGKLISAFVEERVDGPLKGEEELWQEAVFGGLFSAAFVATMRLPDVCKDPESLQQTVSSTIGDVVDSAAVWVSQRLTPKSPRLSGIQITVDVSQLMRHRLMVCFNEALAVMADKGWPIETARSHACFVLFSKASTALMIQGLIPDQRAARTFVESAMEGCDSMAAELAQALDRKKCTGG